MAMSRVIWATSQVEAARRFDYYRSGLCSSFVRLTPDPPVDVEAFDATLTHWTRGRHEVTVLSARSHCIQRTHRDVVEAEDDNVYLNFVASGELLMDQCGARHRARAGDIVLVDNARPFSAEVRRTRGHRLLVFKMDRALFAASADQTTHRLASHELAPALRQTLSYLSRADGGWTETQIADAANGIESLTRLMLSPDAGRPALSRAQGTLEKVRALLALRCCSPEFGLDEACRELGMSRRSLQMHLSLSGETLASLLSEERLKRAHALLVGERSRGAGIEALCRDCGFQNVSTFYRAYKRRYGRPPGSFWSR